MITALISTVTGLISGTVPNLLKEWGATREHNREVEMLKIQTELQLKIAEKEGETRVVKVRVNKAVSAKTVDVVRGNATDSFTSFWGYII